MATQCTSRGFTDAFNQYIRNLPEKKNKKSVLSRLDLNNPPTPESIQESMSQMEAKNSHKPSVRIMKKVLGPVIMAMKDYYSVLDTLTQADPTPGMIIWGALKIVIDGLGRFIDLFDRIKAELMSLTTQLRRMALYEDLYGESIDMQDCLFKSYINVFRFWCRVDKECNRCSLSTLLRASTSFSLKELQSIVQDLKQNADETDKLGHIIEGQYAGVEREEAGFERKENKKERDEGSKWRKQMQSDRIVSWLGGQAFNESTLTRHQNNLDVISAGATCDWLFKENIFQEWVDGTSNKPIIWLFAGPGSGKSVLCSHTCRYVENLSRGTKVAVALHFYAFDDQKPAVVTARGLAAQLFSQYWCLHKDIPEDVQDASQKSAAGLSNVLDFIRILVSKLPNVFIFLDGMDEECNTARWVEALKMTDFFISLAETFPHTMRLWYSTQDTFLVRKKLERFPVLNIKDRIAGAVDEYIASKVPGLDNVEVSQETREWILTELQGRAEGNFLWASLMLKTIENEVSSFDEMEQFIKEGLPRDLDQYYRQLFSRYETKERELASKIFALITFAKRRLRLSELREAIGIISCSDPRALKRHSIPWQQAVKKLFAPLIETQPDPKNADDCFCHLFHGTVRDFLLKNQDIFRLGQTVVTNRLVSEMVIAEACLLYLSQEKYSQLLAKRSSQWVTTLGEDLSDHHLLTYSAKYWDKHLDDVQETPQLLYRIEKFLTSSNFQTTLQIQSLCVEGHFGLYTVQGHAGSHKFTKRVFPRWFCENKSGETTDFLGNYRSFISEWQSFLDSATCNDGCCEHMHYARYIGELDRCLWKALGPSNFLSSNHGRYCSFMLTNEQNPLKRHTKLYQDCVTWDGSLVVVLQCATGRDELGTPVSEESSPYRLEFWSMPNHTAPTFLTEELLFTGLDPTKWKTCGRALRESQQSTSFKTVSFSPDLSYLRIGSKVFSKDSSGGYVAIDGLDLTADNMSACFEEITNRARFLVLASRRSMPKPSLNRGRMTDGDASIERGPDSTNAHLEPKLTGVDCGHCSRDPSRSKNGSDTSSPNAANEASSDSDSADASSSSSSESLDCNSAEETWSEGSSDISQLEQVQWRTLDSSEDETSATSESESETDVESDIEDSSEGPVHSYGQLLDESESDGGDIDFGCGSEDDAYQADSDCSDSSDYSKINDDLGFDSGDEDAMHTRLFYKALSQPRVKYPKGCLMIYDLSSNPPNLLFRFSQTLPLMLFDSPPAIHPTQPLVVWPLSGGDILFADFEAKTYFTRRARPSTRRTRHVFVKCRFSCCGRYLHILSLEAQETLLSKAGRKRHAEPSLELSAFLSTHRLSTRKTTRSPPSLIHRAKISLGSTQSLNPARMPVEVTWSPTSVYLSSSSDYNFLSLFRVQLFASPAGQEPSIAAKTPIVSVPKQPILLPQSARSRKVHFFPPSRPHDTHALILIGSWAATPAEGRNASAPEEWDAIQGHSEAVLPPIGFYVSEEADLGGWVESSAQVEMGPENDKGALKAKMERFAPVDDCDIEHFFVAHPPRY